MNFAHAEVATLDPTTRLLNLKDGQQILLTDTVGFIHKLPYTSRLFVYTIRAFWVEILAERKWSGRNSF